MRTPARPPAAATADRLALYAQAVQDPPADAALLARIYRALAGRPLRLLREDFCGTAAIAAAFVRRHAANRALAIDADAPTLAWARDHVFAALPDSARARLTLRCADVRAVRLPRADLVAALNFSWCVFQARAELLSYLRHCRRALRPGGVLVLDLWGGGLVHRACAERHRHRGFDHLWEQRSFEPISHRIDCRIHFAFRDGSWLRDAFVYDWRLWTLPELRDALAEAGFGDVRVFWRERSGAFRQRARAPADAVWLAYVAGR